ncbi:MAG TPA: hypothetical protein VN851_09015 [Thermoanaerobaculia bacterium]|nr:hypothetical protein [Thermoanaerobaculia bacterium]
MIQQLILIAALVAPIPPGAAPGMPDLSPGALRLVRDLKANLLSVDRGGNLWAWESGSGRVALYGPTGIALSSVGVGSSAAVAADREWGVAALSPNGRELRLVPWAGTPSSISMDNDVRSVAWIDQNTIAVAPALAARRVEIWDLRAKKRIREIGAELPLVPGEGVTRLRTIALHYAPERDLLYTLDSYTGDLQVYGMDGRLVRREAVPIHDRTDLDDWLAGWDRDDRAKHQTDTPTIWRLLLAFDSSANLWVVAACEKGKALLFRMPPAGKAETATVDVDPACCSVGATIWQDSLILYHQPERPLCNVVRRITVHLQLDRLLPQL